MLDFVTGTIRSAEASGIIAQLQLDGRLSPENLPTPQETGNPLAPVSCYWGPEKPSLLVVGTNPYLTRVTDTHYMLRAAAMHGLLPKDAGLLMVQGFDPKLAYTNDDLMGLRRGSLKFLARPILEVVNDRLVEKDTPVLLAGYSLVGDIFVDAVTVNQEMKTSLDIQGVIAGDFARSKNLPGPEAARALIKFMNFIFSSGDFNKIVSSQKDEIPELYQAHMRGAKSGIAFQKRILMDAAKYMLADLKVNYAFAVGMATGTTVTRIIENTGTNFVVYRDGRSKVNGLDLGATFAGCSNVHVLDNSGLDHSSNDKIINAGARLLDALSALGIR